MWEILNGTIVNTGTVIVGSLIGLAGGSRLPERYRSIVLATLGLVTLTLGVDAGVVKFGDAVAEHCPPGIEPSRYGATLAMVMIGSLLLGALIGTALRLHERIEAVGDAVHRRFSGGDARGFGEGFLTASVIFCVGPLTLLGCLQNGAHNDPSYLYIKSLLDAFCSIALAASLGWGVFGSVATILVFQGGLSILAWQFAEPLDPLSLALMTVVGGVVLLATALTLLDVKKLPVADLCPAIFLPPFVVWALEAAVPGLLLPVQ